MIEHILKLFPNLLASQEKVAQVSRKLSNKIYQNCEHNAQHLLPGCYFYAGLQIKIKFFSAYSEFLKEEIECWDWLVYDGFGQVVLKSGIGETKDDAIALAQTWTVQFLEGNIPSQISKGNQNA
ncbi:hypothetical protein [Microcoleus sp. POL10_C6]|uniref:hypothetical protein n=1 Tax=Microcoleus sp. POL10_C6 TaxID=2818852 RepID=UPI002FCEDE87